MAVSISTLSKLPRVLKTYKKSQHIKPLMFIYRLDKYLGQDGKNEINLGQSTQKYVGGSIKST